MQMPASPCFSDRECQVDPRRIANACRAKFDDRSPSSSPLGQSLFIIDFYSVLSRPISVRNLINIIEVFFLYSGVESLG